MKDAGIFKSASRTSGSRLDDDFLHREHAHAWRADAQVIPLRFNVGVDDLVVEKLGGLRLSRDTRTASKLSSRRKKVNCSTRGCATICTKSASWRLNASTRCSSRVRLPSIWERNSVFMRLWLN